MFLREGRAAYSGVTGWQIAHVIVGEREWFSVTEADAALLSRLSNAGGVRCPCASG